MVYDHGSYLLTGIMGAEWWIEHGFEREVREGRCMTDFGHPVYKIDFEADGKKWHDVLKDERRDNFMRSRGWFVVRFSYNRMVTHPDQVRKRILEVYDGFAREHSAAYVKEIDRQMRRGSV